MKELPILFSAPMVRAILDGSKTQTRRVVKPQPDHPLYKPVTTTDDEGIDLYLIGRGIDKSIRCPYGKHGDRLWVRETWAQVGAVDPGYLTYRATYPDCLPPHMQNVPADIKEAGYKWTPSIHMPRWASRINLEITGVRVERLQDITEADAKAEGADCLMTHNFTEQERDLLDIPLMEDANPYRNGYALLWESINGPGSWYENPWVWVIEFKRVNQ